MTRIQMRNYQCACGQVGTATRRISGFFVHGSLDIPRCHTCGRIVCDKCSQLQICNQCVSNLSVNIQNRIQGITKSEKSSMWCILSILLGEIISLIYWLREEDGLSFVFVIMGIGIGFAIGIPVMYGKELIDKLRKSNVVHDAKMQASQTNQSTRYYTAPSSPQSTQIPQTLNPPQNSSNILIQQPVTQQSTRSPQKSGDIYSLFAPPPTMQALEDQNSNDAKQKKKEDNDPTQYNWLTQFRK